MHGGGILHRDIRPANIIVAEEMPLAGAVLVDCDLVRITQFDASVDDRSVETARYRSPEQTGSLDYEVAEPADLYSAGVVLFECLAGRPPFEGDSVGGILLQHMTARAPELRSLGLEIPRALDEVVQRLLRKDPRDRYQSAEAVLMDLADIAAALSEGRFEPQGVIGSRDRRPTLTESAFVGRRREIEKLDEQVARACAGRGSLVLVESESGGGKTRLLTELALRCAQQGMMVFRGQGSEQVGRHPFQVLDGVISQLSIAARSNPDLAAAVGRRLGDHRDAAIAAVPELAGVLGWQSLSLLGPEAFGEARSIEALSKFLDALGTPRAAGPGRAGRLPVGRRVDDQADRPLAGEPRRRGRRRARARGGRLPFRGSRRGPRLPPHSLAAPPAAEPLRSRTTCGGWRSRWPGRCPRRRSMRSLPAPTAALSWPPPCCAGWWNRGPWWRSRRAGGSSPWPWPICTPRVGPAVSSPAASSSCRSPPSTCW